jgi:hypothetical protein
MAVTDIVKKALEGFQGTTSNDTNDNNAQPPSMSQLFVLTVVIILWFLLVILVGKYLWNECLCKVLTICKPTDDLFVIFGIILLFDILHPKF